MTQNPDHCREILETMEQVHALQDCVRGGDRTLRFKLWQLEDREYELRRNAAAEFAALNGWKYSKKSFAPAQLARGSTQRKMCEAWDAGWVHELFDHPVYFREPRTPYRPVAIVGQPYGTGVSDARRILLRIGLQLELHAPPCLTASWWYPSATHFFCFTRPGQSVRFLPDQAQDVEAVSAAAQSAPSCS